MTMETPMNNCMDLYGDCSKFLDLHMAILGHEPTIWGWVENGWKIPMDFGAMFLALGLPH